MSPVTPEGIAAHPPRHPFELMGEQRQRFGLLLASVVIVFAIQGIASPAVWEQVLVALLLGQTFVLALWIARVKRRRLLLGAGIAAVLVVLSVVEAANGSIDNAATRIANALLVAFAPPAIMIGVVRSLRANRGVTLEAVFGVLSVYILIGMFFAALFGAVAHLNDGEFFAQNVQASVPHCMYYSFTTLATVGYGDLTATSNFGHTLSVSEALVGQIYLVTIVSLIVANLGRRREPERSEPTQRRGTA